MISHVLKKYGSILALVGLSITSLLFAADTKDGTPSFNLLVPKDLGFGKHAINEKIINNETYHFIKVESKKSGFFYPSVRKRLDGCLPQFDLAAYIVEKILPKQDSKDKNSYFLLKPRNSPKKVVVNVVLYNGHKMLTTMEVECYESNKVLMVPYIALYHYEKDIKKSRVDYLSVDVKFKGIDELARVWEYGSIKDQLINPSKKIEYIKVNVGALKSNETFWSKFRSSKFSRYTWRSTLGRVVMVVGVIVFVGYQYLVSTAEPAESEV